MKDRLASFFGLHRVEKKTGFVLSEEMLAEVVRGLISDSVSGLELRNKLLALARLPSGSKNKFRTDKTGQFKNGGTDILVEDGESSKVILTLGIGETSVVCMNKFTLPEGIIYKYKPKVEIRSRKELTETVDRFIRFDATPGEIIDNSKEGKEKRAKR